MKSAAGIEIRRLTREDQTDVVLYRDIRLEALLATFRRKIREPECWGRIGAFAIFCKAGRI